jgi:hypothetical protein
MISYKQWKLLNESLGSFNLGIKNPHNLGLVSQHDVVSDEDKANFEEMGMMPRMPKMHMDDADGLPFMKKKKPMPPMDGDMDMGDEELPMDMDDEEMGDEDAPMGDDDDMGDEEMDQSIDPDADMDDEDMNGDDMGDEDMGDEDDEMGDEDMGDDDMAPPMPMKKRFSMGEPHKTGPFMQFAKKMKEGCGDKDMDIEGGDSDDVPEKGKEIAFLQKKNMKKKMSSGDATAKATKLQKPVNGDGKAAPKGNPGVKKFQKKCSTGDDGSMKMCGKCKKQKKNMKESSGYERPAPLDNSDAGFFSSIANMYGNPNERFSDGMRDFSEDMLVPPAPEPVDTPGPGQIGYAPQTRIGDDNIGETVQNLMAKIANLEKQLKNK